MHVESVCVWTLRCSPSQFAGLWDDGIFTITRFTFFIVVSVQLLLCVLCEVELLDDLHADRFRDWFETTAHIDCCSSYSCIRKAHTQLCSCGAPVFGAIMLANDVTAVLLLLLSNMGKFDYVISFYWLRLLSSSSSSLESQCMSCWECKVNSSNRIWRAVCELTFAATISMMCVPDKLMEFSI